MFKGQSKMFDEKIVEAVTKIANARIKKEYPLRDDNVISEWETRMVLEATYSLMYLWEKEKKK